MDSSEAMAPIVRNQLGVAALIIGRSTASVEVREIITVQNWASLIPEHLPRVQEWAILTTCHRFELYIAAEQCEMDSVCAQAEQVLTRLVGAVEDTFTDGASKPWTWRRDVEAAQHLCKVAAGLDSLVFGEAQIQGQVIASYTQGLEAGTVGPILSSLFRSAIRVGKRARTETQISARAVSMSSVALSMAARYFADFSKARVLVLGAGEMSRLALKALLQRHVVDVTVANRTLARAQSLLMDPQWRAVELDTAKESLLQYDVIFSATSAPGFMVTREDFMRNLARNGASHKHILIDLAVPRDVEPVLRTWPDVVLVDVDDLRQGLDQSLEFRKQALPAVLAIIEDELTNWQAQQRELSLRPVVVKLRRQAEEIRRNEVERTMRFLGSVEPETREHIQHLSRAIVNKILHEPTIRIKEIAHVDDADVYLSTICELFNLQGDAGAGDEVTDHVELKNDTIEEHAKLRGEASCL